jgi:hypothetical protein
MNNIELNHCLAKIIGIRKITFGVFSADVVNKIIQTTKNPSVYIINLEDSTLKGSHWICMTFLDNKWEVFDSFGKSLSSHGVYFRKLAKICLWENLKPLQSNFSISCGIFCLYYCFYKVRSCKSKVIINRFKTNMLYNEMLVNCFYKKYFKKLPVINTHLPWFMC